MGKTAKAMIYILVSYVLFLVFTFYLNEEAKVVKPADLRNAEDWFYFLWLFLVPLLIDVVIIGVPIIVALGKPANRVNTRIQKIVVIVFFFLLDYCIARTIYGAESALVKILIIVLLFPLFFWKEIFLNKNS